MPNNGTFTDVVLQSNKIPEDMNFLRQPKSAVWLKENVIRNGYSSRDGRGSLLKLAGMWRWRAEAAAWDADPAPPLRNSPARKQLEQTARSYPKKI